MVEDIALIVDEMFLPVGWKANLEGGRKLLKDVSLFDLFRGEKIGEQEELAYQLTYQAFDRTLSVADAAAIRKKIVKTCLMKLKLY